MTIQLFVGLITEGTTDNRFLKPIVQKTLINIAFEAKGQIDTDVKIVECHKGNNFTEYVLNGANKGIENYGISLLVIHADADESNSKQTYDNKINPAVEQLLNKDQTIYCKHIAALVPIYETESWMLADKELFKKAIGTKKDDATLGINGNPELMNNPKEKIEKAITIGRSDMPKKMRNSLNISDLYSYIGESIQIDHLQKLSSFNDFENNIKRVLIELNFMLPDT